MFFRQFGDANPNSIESSYYERTIDATYTYGADHINGEHHIYSLFYGISNVPATNSRMLKNLRFFFSNILFVEMLSENYTNTTGIPFGFFIVMNH